MFSTRAKRVDISNLCSLFAPVVLDSRVISLGLLDYVAVTWVIAVQRSDVGSHKPNRKPLLFVVLWFLNPTQIWICLIRGPVWHRCFLLLSRAGARAFGGNTKLKSNLAWASGFHQFGSLMIICNYGFPVIFSFKGVPLSHALHVWAWPTR